MMEIRMCLRDHRQKQPVQNPKSSSSKADLPASSFLLEFLSFPLETPAVPQHAANVSVNAVKQELTIRILLKIGRASDVLIK